MTNTILAISLGERSTNVEVAGIPGVKMIRLKFIMPGCGCLYHFKGYLDDPYEQVDSKLAKEDIESFMKLFLIGDQLSVNYCQQCGRRLPKI